MIMRHVTREQLVQLIKETNGSIFTVLYEKVRSNGEIRKVNCRLNVTKHLKGTGKAASPEAQVITVYDLQKQGYRSLGIEGLIEAQIHGEVYKIQ
jgi:hypothetical protein